MSFLLEWLEGLEGLEGLAGLAGLDVPAGLEGPAKLSREELPRGGAGRGRGILRISTKRNTYFSTAGNPCGT